MALVLVVFPDGRVRARGTGVGAFGISEDERPSDLNALARRAPALATAAERARGGDALDDELDAGGHTFALHARPWTDPTGERGALLFAIELSSDGCTRVRERRLLRDLYDHLPLGLHALDAQLRLVAVNPAAEQFSGWRAEELLGAPYPGLPDEERRAPEALPRGENVMLADIKVRRRDGSAGIFRRYLAAIPAPRSDATFLAVFDDVTARVPVEDAQARLAAIVKATLDPIVAVDTTGAVTSWNAAAERVFGRSSSEVVGRPLVEILTRSDRARVVSFAEAAVRGETLEGYDLDVGEGDARIELRWALTPVLGAGERLIGAAGVARDVTTERRQQLALARAADRSEALAEVSRAMLASPLDARAVCEAIACSLAEHVGDACVVRLASPDAESLVLVAMHHRDPAGLAQLSECIPVMETFGLAECFRTGRPLLLDAEALTRLTASIPAQRSYMECRPVIASTLVPIRSGRRSLGVLAVLYEARSTEPSPEDVAVLLECGRRAGDALERARSFEEARKARRRAERSRARLAAWKAQLELRVVERTTQLSVLLEDVEMMSYAMSHDLQQAMRHIDANAALVCEDEGLSSAARERLGRTRAAARRAARLVDRLVDIARIARPELQPELVDISALVEEVRADLHAVDPSRAVHWDVQPGVLARADRELLRVVLRQLCENAWKFTAPHPSARIAFGAEPRQGTEAYYVRDDGIGFDMAYVAKLFSPLRQLNPPYAFEGAGLGLATVRHIVARMGGRVWAEGELEQGATFWFTLQ